MTSLRYRDCVLFGVQFHYQCQGTEELDFVVAVVKEAPGKLPAFARFLQPVKHILNL